MLLKILKNSTRIIFFGLVFFGFTGCVVKTSSLEANLNENKSVVILPILKEGNTKVYWSKIGGTDKAKDFFTNNTEVFKIGYNYVAIPMDAGVYYIQNISVQNRAYEYEKKFRIANTKKYNSLFEDIALEKTPEKYRNREYVTSKNGKGEMKTVIEDVVSYYKFDYLFNSNNSIGTITIKPNEIVLIPAINIDIELEHNSCKPINVKEDSSFDKFLGSSHSSILGSWSDAVSTSNGFYTWSWSCPIKTFIVDVQKSPLEDFRIYAEAYKITYNAPHIFAKPIKKEFPEELLSQVVVRDFEFGKLLKQVKKAESLEDGVERYVISGDTDEKQ